MNGLHRKTGAGIGLLQRRHLTNKKTSGWMKQHVKDHWVKQSIKDEVRARSAYKFEELQQKYALIKTRNDFVIDLGASPGGWSIMMARDLELFELDVWTGKRRGLLVSVDLLPMEPIAGVSILQADYNSPELRQYIEDLAPGRRATLVASDMLHNTTGLRDTDHFRSMDICYGALDFAKLYLAEGGSFVAKIFSGSDEKELLTETKSLFALSKLVKPKASRSESAEKYLVCTGFKP